MGTKIYQDYQHITLQPFAEKLQADYYEAIEKSCAYIKLQCEKIRNIEKSASPLQYVALCEKILTQIEKHAQGRNRVYVPYVHQLTKKVAENHDCSGCSGACKVNHNMHIMDLNATNEEIAKVLNMLQIATLPLHAETLYPEEYRVLRSNMTLIETNLTELFFLENNYLIPKIAEAQKNINAGNR
jgi:hypothetical protein